MSCTTLSEVTACEGGTLLISFICLDEADSVAIPTALYWQLSNKAGTVINGRDFDSNDITGTQTEITIDDVTGYGYKIVLSGDDLIFQGTSTDGVRYVAIKGTYDSSSGNDLPIRGELRFEIQNLVNF